MSKIAVLGVGLIGGSLALCFKGKPGMTVTGYSPNPQSVEKYKRSGVVDEATTSLEQAIDQADIIFMCGPVGVLESQLTQIMALPLKEGCIVTDVGSTKLSLVRTAERLRRDGVYFIGGHPMAGKEKSGVEAATSRLFENAVYVLTPASDVPEEQVDRLAGLLELTRAQIVRLDAALHDKIVGAISHLPHIIAVALVNQISRYDANNEWYKQLAAGGFRDITRIASADPVIWRDILLHNREIVLRLLEDWKQGMTEIQTLIEQSDGEGIAAAFARAGQFRSAIPERGKGMLTGSYDLYVDIPDEPGIIGTIASSLGDRRINLSNIHIIENRLDVPGVLRLSFREEDNMEQAIQALIQMGLNVSK